MDEIGGLSPELAQIGDKVRVVLEHVGNRLQRVTRWGVEGGQFNQVVRDFERDRRSHNGHYVTRGVEAAPWSTPRST